MKPCKIVFVIAPKNKVKAIELSKFTLNETSTVELFGHSHFLFDLRKMLKSDLVVTAGDWHEDPSCVKAVNIARIADLTVIHESHFKTYAEQNNN